MNKYIVTVNHDTGVVKIKTTARTKAGAMQIVVDAEKCPPSAIISIERIAPNRERAF